MEAITPTLGLGISCHVEATTLFPYRPTMEQHLSFEKGETIYVSEQQVIKYIYNIDYIKKNIYMCFIKYIFSIILFRLIGGMV